MRRFVGTSAAVAAFSMMAAGAQANIVYTKGSKIYTATNAGKNAKQIGTGEDAAITPDGQTVIYTNSTDVLFRVPFAGGPSTAFGGAVKWCVKCTLSIAPDSRSALLLGQKGELDNVPIDGSAPIRVATGAGSQAGFSPDSKRIAYEVNAADAYSVFTTPATGPAPVKLPAGFIASPVWTSAGIVASTIVRKGNKPQFQIVLLDPAGNVKRVLQRKTIKSAKALARAVDIQDAAWRAGSNVITYAEGKKSTSIIRLVSTANGKVRSKLTFNRRESVWAANPTGTTLLLINKKGRLQSVNVKSGKRKTLVKSGVGSADISR